MFACSPCKSQPTRAVAAPPTLAVLRGPSVTTNLIANQFRKLQPQPFRHINAAGRDDPSLSPLLTLSPFDVEAISILDRAASTAPHFPLRTAVVYQSLPSLMAATKGQGVAALHALAEFAVTWKGSTRTPNSVGFLTHKQLQAAIKSAVAGMPSDTPETKARQAAVLERFATRLLGMKPEGVHLVPRYGQTGAIIASDALSPSSLANELLGLNGQQSLPVRTAASKLRATYVPPTVCTACRKTQARTHPLELPLCGTCLDSYSMDVTAAEQALPGFITMPEPPPNGASLSRPWLSSMKTGTTYWGWGWKEQDNQCCNLYLETINGLPQPSFASIVASVPTGQKWTDPATALIVQEKPTDIWAQPEVAWPNKPIQLFITGTADNTKVAMGDVNQGGIGDCWFITAIAAGVQLGLIESLFTNVDEAKGVYEVTFHSFDKTADGWANVPISVCVDRQVPMRFYSNSTTSRYVYSVKSQTPGELWPSLLEKALAKLAHRVTSAGIISTGYPAITGGWTSWGMAMLFGGHATGMQKWSTKPFPSGADLFADWAMLTQQYRAVIGCAWDASVTGLVSGHAYTVLDLKEVPTSAEPGAPTVKLIRFRNPWGVSSSKTAWLCTQDVNYMYEWRGDWSDCSDLWWADPVTRLVPSYVAQQVGFSLAANVDGIFWMSANDAAAHCSAMFIWEPPQ